MQTESTLSILREKIYQIRSALMYSMSNDLIKMPNSIVTVLRVDEAGDLWFLSKRPSYPLNQCEESFPVRLVFYRKGISFRMEISGKATIVKAGGEDLFSVTDGAGSEAPVLIKLNMNNVQCTERKEKSRPGQISFVSRTVL